jgi:Ca2+-binding EF-hand superfamily protein
MTKHRRATKFGQNQKDAGQLLDSRHVKAADEDFLATNARITERIFAGRETITEKEYLQLRKDIQEQLWHYDFCQYECDEKSETISAGDFARSLLIYMPFSKFNHYISRIETELEHLKTGRVTFDQFVAFQYFLGDVEAIKDHVNQYRFIDKKQLAQLVSEFHGKNAQCKANGRLRVSQTQIDVFFEILDLDKSGKLEQEEIVGVLDERQLLGQGKQDELKQNLSSGYNYLVSMVK